MIWLTASYDVGPSLFESVFYDTLFRNRDVGYKIIDPIYFWCKDRPSVICIHFQKECFFSYFVLTGSIQAKNY